MIVPQLDDIFDHITSCNQWIKELGSEHEKHMAEELESSFFKAYDDMMLLSVNIRSLKPNQAISDSQIKVIDNFKDVCQAIITLTNTSSENSKLRKIMAAQKEFEKHNTILNQFYWLAGLKLLLVATKVMPKGAARDKLLVYHGNWAAECHAAWRSVTVTEVRASLMSVYWK